MADLLADLAAGEGNHGSYISSVADLTNEWKDSGLITGSQKGAIQRAAATFKGN